MNIAKILKGSFLNIGFQIFPVVFAIVMVPITIKLYGIEQFALFTLAITQPPAVPVPVAPAAGELSACTTKLQIDTRGGLPAGLHGGPKNPPGGPMNATPRMPPPSVVCTYMRAYRRVPMGQFFMVATGVEVQVHHSARGIPWPLRGMRHVPGVSLPATELRPGELAPRRK